MTTAVLEQMLGRRRYRRLRWWCAAASGVGLAEQIRSRAPRIASPAQVVAESHLPALHEVRGAIHAHTTYSDGAGGFPEIIAAARLAGLDFLLTACAMAGPTGRCRRSTPSRS